MPAKETPLATLKRLYGTKDKLIDAVVKSLKDVGEEPEDLDERLVGAPNSKLLRLVRVAEEVKQRFGSKDAMIEALASARNKAKDADYIGRLGRYPITKLLDLTRAAQRRVSRKGKAA